MLHERGQHSDMLQEQRRPCGAGRRCDAGCASAGASRRGQGRWRRQAADRVPAALPAQVAIQASLQVRSRRLPALSLAGLQHAVARDGASRRAEPTLAGVGRSKGLLHATSRMDQECLACRPDGSLPLHVPHRPHSSAAGCRQRDGACLHVAEAGGRAAQPLRCGHCTSFYGGHRRQARVDGAGHHIPCMDSGFVPQVLGPSEGWGVAPSSMLLVTGQGWTDFPTPPVCGSARCSTTAQAPQPPSPHPSFTPCMSDTTMSDG